MKRRIFRLALVALATAAVLGVVAGPALALDSTPTITVEKRAPANQPNDLFWWFNTPYPSVSFSVETTSPWVDGYLYSLDHVPGTVPTLPSPIGQVLTAFAPVAWPGQDSISTNPTWHPLFSGSVDMRGWADEQVDPYVNPNIEDSAEGVWWIHARAISATDTVMSPVAEGAFGIDITPPTGVTGLHAADNQPNAWRELARRDFTWDFPYESYYDKLSGESLWSIRLNGGNWHTFRALDPDTFPFGFASVEDLRSGRNKIEVRVIDYAQNSSLPSVTYANVDTDTPSAAITSGDSFGKAAVFSVDARDAAGISSVVFKVDGVTVGTDTTKPYSVSYNTSGLSNVGSHSLQVIAKDMLGGQAGNSAAVQARHQAAASRSFYVDSIAPAITSIYDTPDPFYPMVRDGYKDNLKVGFKLSERSYARLQIFSGSTKIREIAGWRSAGSQSFVWDGKNSSGVRKTGTYYYRIVATDAAGNTTYSSKRTAVATTGYFIVLDSSNSAHVVRR